MEHSAELDKIKPRGSDKRHACRAQILRVPIFRAIPLLLAVSLTGCSGHSGPFSMFSGIAAKPPPAAPGLASPFPHLASVPAKPTTLSAADQQHIRAQLEAANQAGHAALLPAPPAPAPSSAAVPAPQTPPPGPPLLIGFPRNSAIIPRAQHLLLRQFVQGRGPAPAVIAAGFAPTPNAEGLRLALRRALAIADQLTNAGLPLADIRLAALTTGHGGFAQLVYDVPPQSSAKPKPSAKPAKDRS